MVLFASTDTAVNLTARMLVRPLPTQKETRQLGTVIDLVAQPTEAPDQGA